MSNEFRARIDIYAVTPTSGTTWSIQGKIIDPTGAFCALDVSVGDKLIQRGVDADSHWVYDRYKVITIEGRNAVDISIIVQNDTNAIQSASGYPSTGSFPMGSEAWYEGLTVKASFYQNQFDPDYDAGIDNLNLDELIGLLRTLDCNHIQGGHHCYATINERDSISTSLRMWGMYCSVFNDPINSYKNGNYELVYNHSSSDITDNGNWKRLDKNVFEITNSDHGTILASTHKGGMPIVQLYKTIGTQFFATQVQYEVTANGDITWTAKSALSGYIVLV